MRLELCCCESTLMREISDKRITQKSLALTYYLAMRSRECERINWARVNIAIIKRWSISGLDRVKRMAWKHVETSVSEIEREKE